MGSYSFSKDLPVAKETEKEVASMLQNVFNAEILSFDNTNKYDILAKIKGEEISFEIKEDFSCEKTGNIAVEFGCRGKDSGIMTTQADYYIYKVHTQNNGICFVFHKTSVLRDMISRGKFFRIVNGGDRGSNSMNYLFKYSDFIAEGKVLFAS